MPAQTQNNFLRNQSSTSSSPPSLTFNRQSLSPFLPNRTLPPSMSATLASSKSSKTLGRTASSTPASSASPAPSSTPVPDAEREGGVARRAFPVSSTPRATGSGFAGGEIDQAKMNSRAFSSWRGRQEREPEQGRRSRLVELELTSSPPSPLHLFSLLAGLSSPILSRSSISTPQRNPPSPTVRLRLGFEKLVW